MREGQGKVRKEGGGSRLIFDFYIPSTVSPTAVNYEYSISSFLVIL